MTASLVRLPLLLILVLPMPACAASGGSVATGPGLTENRWRPIQIGGHTVTVPEQQHEPWIHLDSKSKRVTGSGGCNRFNGSFQAGDGTLRFGELVSTKMACPSMKTESAFLQALDKTRRYRVTGRLLELMDDRKRVLVRLEERNL